MLEILVRDGSENGELIGMPAQIWQLATEENARHVRLDWREFTTLFGGRVGLGVPQILLSRPSPQEDDHARASLAKLRTPRFNGNTLRPQQARPRKPQRAHASHFQKAASRESVEHSSQVPLRAICLRASPIGDSNRRGCVREMIRDLVWPRGRSRRSRPLSPES